MLLFPLMPVRTKFTEEYQRWKHLVMQEHRGINVMNHKSHQVQDEDIEPEQKRGKQPIPFQKIKAVDVVSTMDSETQSTHW